MAELFPEFSYQGKTSAKETIHQYAQVLAAIRQSMTPAQRHWAHAGLQITASGLTTRPILHESGVVFELIMDLARHSIQIVTSEGGSWTLPFYEQSPRELYWQIENVLMGLGIAARYGDYAAGDHEGAYDREVAQNILRVMTHADAVLKKLKGTIHGNTSPVQLWPHHFDVSTMWITGRLVEGSDPEDEDNSDEQMNFGFSFGDEGIPEPYFYVTMYPWREAIREYPLADNAYWQQEGWQGAVMNYSSLQKISERDRTVFEFYSSLKQAGESALNS